MKKENSLIFTKKLFLQVLPLYKFNDLQDQNNYRPISLLSVFSKIVEKTVKEQLESYLHENNILSDYQYGFSRDKNIGDALFYVEK